MYDQIIEVHILRLASVLLTHKKQKTKNRNVDRSDKCMVLTSNYEISIVAIIVKRVAGGGAFVDVSLVVYI